MSFAKATAAVCSVLAILLGPAVLMGWAPIQGSVAVSFVLSGLALLGIVTSKPQLTWMGCATAATSAAFSLLEPMFGATPGIAPAAAICFLVLATGFVLAQKSRMTNKSAVLGITGLLVSALGVRCAIGGFS